MKKPIIKKTEKTTRKGVKRHSSPSSYNKNEYRNYTRTKYWKETREKILHLRGHRCQFCGRTEEDGISLSVHHSPQGYYYLGHEMEHLDLMLVVCNVCHFKGHRGGDSLRLFSKKEEIWKKIEDCPDYEISNFGNVRNKDKYLMSTRDNGHGYIGLPLINKEGKYVNKYVHRLVAEAFIPNPDNLPQINHKDEIKSHNWVDNLEWCTAAYGSQMEK